jgi:hypothetical protein
MLVPELIRKKRDGGELSEAEIDCLVRGIADGTVSDAQVGALAMAIVLRGMSAAERISLTGAMTRSGEVLDWSGAGLHGPALDKHSTGGVGDKVSLMLAPIVAACGGAVPMIAGRGLGHTGGTLDKLEAIPGYQTAPEPAVFRQAVARAGCAIVGQTAKLAPADRRLYAIRDATGTVESIPLLVASILSKKLAAGLDALIIDVKVGSGALLPDRADAEGRGRPGRARGPGRAAAGARPRRRRGRGRTGRRSAAGRVHGERRRPCRGAATHPRGPPVIPKAELHVHLEGTAPPALVRRLAERNGLAVPDGLFDGSDRFAYSGSSTSCALMTRPPARSSPAATPRTCLARRSSHRPASAPL